jgi:hypothetical protein
MMRDIRWKVRLNGFIAVLAFVSMALPVPARSEDSSGSLWLHNANTVEGKSYLVGFARGYIEGKQQGLDLIGRLLPYARFDPTTRIDREEIESRVAGETRYGILVVEGENLGSAVDQVTEWYQDGQNQDIAWDKLLELSIAKTGGAHDNYVQYQLNWLRDLSHNGQIDWFHTIDPGTGEGPVSYYDKAGKIVRMELVR